MLAGRSFEEELGRDFLCANAGERLWRSITYAAAAALPEPRMRARHLYLALCLIGTLLPLGAFLPFLGMPGAGPRLFFQQLFATPVSGFFGWDVIVSSLVLWTFVLVEGRRLAMRGLWGPIVANLLVGVSLGLPLFLYMREIQGEGANHHPA